MEIVDKLKERIVKTELRKKDTYAHYFFILENQQLIMEGLAELLEPNQAPSAEKPIIPCPRCGCKLKGLHSIECVVNEIREQQRAIGTCPEFLGERR